MILDLLKLESLTSSSNHLSYLPPPDPCESHRLRLTAYAVSLLLRMPRDIPLIVRSTLARSDVNGGRLGPGAVGGESAGQALKL